MNPQTKHQSIISSLNENFTNLNITFKFENSLFKLYKSNEIVGAVAVPNDLIDDNQHNTVIEQLLLLTKSKAEKSIPFLGLITFDLRILIEQHTLNNWHFNETSFIQDYENGDLLIRLENGFLKQNK